VGTDFASGIRSLARQYSPERARRRPPSHDLAGDDSTGEVRDTAPPRLMGWESLRYAIAVAAVVVVGACAWVFERATRFAGGGAPDRLSPGELDRIGVALAVIGWGLLLGPLATLAWATIAHAHGRRFRVVGVQPNAVMALAGIDALVVAATGAFDPRRTSSLSAAAVLLGVALAMAALFHVRGVQAELENSQTPTMGWIAMLPIGAVLAVIGPLRTAADGGSKSELAFFAVTLGVALAVTGSLAAVATRDLEDAVRGSTRR
jgi:hypothetical protein